MGEWVGGITWHGNEVLLMIPFSESAQQEAQFFEEYVANSQNPTTNSYSFNRISP